MKLESLFSAANWIAAVGWIALAVLPRWRWASRVLAPLVIPALLAVVYGLVLVPNLLDADGGFGSLREVGELFETRELLLAGWLHWLAFDLFVGAWEVRDAQRVGIRHLVVLPCLVATFAAGPLGLALYLLLRSSRTRAVIDEAGG